jgi:DNA-binding CsgD family transcriptional regulator
MDTPPNLNRLSVAEREVLALLAEGHTVKSIAAATARSEGSVNERLREARRKTGVGSSRELARLVRAQKSRDEEIGVPEPAPVEAGRGRVPTWARGLGVLIMTTAIASLIAVALKLSTPDAQAPQTLFQAAAGRHYGDAVSWREETRAQPRNAAWADPHEALLRRRYAAIKAVDMASLRVTCRESKCEVLGRSVAGSAPETLKQAIEELTSPAMRSSLQADGLHAAFTNCGGRDVTREISFLAYWVSPDD